MLVARNIIISFDGTWNTPDRNPSADGDASTNVWKLHQAICDSADGDAQLKWYETGVGTRWYDKLRGGAFGVGLSRKIQEGYRQLTQLYEEGDRVFIFGFSRGAYSARSLVGMIRNCGLLLPEHHRRVSEAYSLYRTRDEGADSENARFFRRQYSREIPIHFLGVWDTVGALGIPVQSFNWFNQAFYRFHDTELSGIVRHGFHAVAVDEHRRSYCATLWDPKEKPNQTIEQVWFAGAHANVGGGYADNPLSDLPLHWMAEKASEYGLAIDRQRLPALATHLPDVTDSWRQFLGGAYSKVEPRHYRPIGATCFGQEKIDQSVLARAAQLADYRPKNPVLDHLLDGPLPGGRIRP